MPNTVMPMAEDEYADMPPLISIAELHAQQQHTRRVLAPSMDHFIDTRMRRTLHPTVCEQRRSARLAERNSRCGPGADVSGTPRCHLFFNQDDEDDHVDY